ncbi:MAG: NADH-quinone oxidoreductase subunit H [Patescibacteria group bacterium]
MYSFIPWLLQLLFIPAFAPLCIGLTRKIKAKFQNRQGASIWQPYLDLWKLFHKDEIISEDASWVFRFAPYLVFGVTLAIGASLPLLSTLTRLPTGDFLGIVYLIALGTFFLALSGVDTGGGFGGFGGSREMLVSSLTEGGLILSLFTLALIAKSTNLFSISAVMLAVPSFAIIPAVLAFISFCISMLAESSRYPFDNPATHLELTMIHEAMILEYSGKRLALMEWAAANKYLIFISLAVNLFYPAGLATTLGLGSLLIAFGALTIKVAVLCAGVATLESSIAKLRIFRLPDLLFTSFIISLIAISIIA